MNLRATQLMKNRHYTHDQIRPALMLLFCRSRRALVIFRRLRGRILLVPFLRSNTPHFPPPPSGLTQLTARRTLGEENTKVGCDNGFPAPASGTRETETDWDCPLGGARGVSARR